MIEIPERIIATIRRYASYGVTTGRQHIIPQEKRYQARCSHFHWHTGTSIIFTRDSGHHSSGWMKNPWYERCQHLSLSFREPFPQRGIEELANTAAIIRLGIGIPLAPFDNAIAAAWVQAILGDGAKFAWHESPFSERGKIVGVQHWRVFCDLAWEPLKPQGEVYSKDFTEKGWKSWSELQGEKPNWVSAE